MVKILRKELLTFPKIDQKKILTIAEVENKTAKRLIYYLSLFRGGREDKKHRINKNIYEQEKARSINTQTL